MAPGKQNNSRVFGLRQPEERVTLRAKERCQALYVRCRKRVGQNVGNNRAVLERNRFRRRLRAIRRHPPASVRRSCEVDGEQVEIRSLRYRNTHQRAQESRVGKKQLRRKVAVLHEPALAVNVLQDHTQQLGALNDPGFDGFPFFLRDEKEGDRWQADG